MTFQRLIEFMKLTPAYSVYSWYQKKNAYGEWEKRGRPVPPPHCVKQQVILQYARRFSLDTLVETGTYLGEMVRAVKDVFSRIISIELDPVLARKAQKKFSGYIHITIIQGDSGETIKEILPGLKHPCLFWLDSHYSGGLTAKGESETPIMKELSHIFAHPVRDHVILIDDARCFDGKTDYPALDALREYVLSERPGWSFAVLHDIIRIHKKD